MEEVVGMLAITGFFSSVILFIYLHFKTRLQERMALIQSGKEASIFQKGDDKKRSLKLGIVAVAAGLGILAGQLLESVFVLNDGVGFFSMILLFCGCGLLLYYYIAGKKTEEAI